MIKKYKQKIETIPKPLKRVTLHPKFKNTISNISNLKIIEVEHNIGFGKYDVISNQIMKFYPLEEVNVGYELDAKKGMECIGKYPLIAAYDESINKFTALEGIAYLFSHTLVYMYEGEYLPSSLIALYFFTKAKKYKSMFNSGVVVTEDIPYASKEVYVRDKVDFLKENLYSNTLLFIDGPLIGGDWYVYVINAIYEFFTPKNIIPVFIVKNSQSSIIVDNIPQLKGRYNSDMHWVYSELRKGMRTAFFKYEDPNNPRNARIFCYIKAFDTSPLRVEFHPLTFEKYKNTIQDILDMIYYFLLVQGDVKNPQIRPIAIAEKYARETLHLFNLDEIIKSSRLTPTVNQERFGWSP
ncbi:NurA domain-containing protein [Aciduliprofundum sp. MAR08-339]|uniref:DNA double-strand break repair nuclease NurA n=1 Tax=Aciduliprofundum sp. (strain MAR08-339) TaxID=673860 RepID=UPI0002A4B49D|nr:NurA domain-containing protein [Aciduliprofundum sp. MAR08-339]